MGLLSGKQFRSTSIWITWIDADASVLLLWGQQMQHFWNGHERVVVNFWILNVPISLHTDRVPTRPGKSGKRRLPVENLENPEI